MALRFIDGFDHYAVADITRKWSTVNGGVSLEVGRNGSCLMTNGWIEYVSKSFDNQDTFIIGFAFKWGSGYGNESTIVSFNDGSTPQVYLKITDDAKVSLYQNNGTLLGISTNTLASGFWNYLEFKIVIGNVGSYEFRVNGSSSGWIPLASGDTQFTANAYVNNIVLGGQPFFGAGEYFTLYFDDLYILDGTAGLNDFLGDMIVETLYPNGNGTNSDFVGSDADQTDNYLLVDETSFNTTDYTIGSTAGEIDSYAFSDTTAISTVKAIQVNSMVKKDVAETKAVANTCISGATTLDGDTGYLSTDYLDFMTIYEVDPNTSAAWTPANLNSAEFGLKVIT